MRDERRKTYIDPEERQYILVCHCTAHRLPDGSTLLVTRLHNAVTVNPNRTAVYQLLPRQEGRRILTESLNLPYNQVTNLMPFEHDRYALDDPGEW